MLSFVRKHADSWMIKSILWMVVLAFVATIFYSWGMGGASESAGGVVATVEGTQIRFGEYEKTFNRLVRFYQTQFPNQFSQEMIEKLDLKTAALDGLIHKKLLLMEAGKYEIDVSDEELIDRIKTNPNFQRNNKFDRSLYTNYLKFNRLTPKEFEEAERETIVLNKMQQLVKSQEKVSGSEIIEAFRQEESKIKFDYISLPDDHFKSSESISEAEKKKYYDKNKSSFQVPEQIRVQYVKLETKIIAEGITPRDEDIEDYYKSQMGKFFIKERFKARHILIRVATDGFDNIADEKEREKKFKESEKKSKKKIDEILKKIRDENNFEEMAEKHSEDKVSGKNGGDLGIFPRGTMLPEFEKALVKLKVGEISEPVLTPFGYHIIRLDDKKESRTQPLEEVREYIIKSVKEIKARQRARRIAKHIYKSANFDQNLSRAAKQENVEVKTTDFISARNHSVADIGIVPEFFNHAFSLGDKKVGEPVHTAEASFVILVSERKAPYIPELSQVEIEVEAMVQKIKNQKLTEENIKVFEKQVAENKSLDKVAESLKLEVRHTSFFSAVDSIPGIGDIKEIKDSAFGLKKQDTAMIKARNQLYIILLSDTQSAGTLGKDQEKTIYTRLQQQKSEATFNSWLEKLRKRSEILIDQTLL